VTLLQVLTHTTGLPEEAGPLLDADVPWDEVLSAVCRSRTEPGDGPVASYSRQTGWFVLAEVLSRVTGRPPQDVDEELGLRAVGALTCGTAPYRPGRSTVGPLAELAALGRALWPGATEVDGYLDAATRAEIVRPWRTGLVDAAHGTDTSWGLGLAVDGRLFGRGCSPLTFGHLGAPETFVLFDPVSAVGIAARFFGVRQSMHGTAIRYLVTEAVTTALSTPVSS
jgi:CubicO group peptidase (beta-lactamase class C family)